MLFVKLTGGPFLRGQYFEICRFLDNINIKNMYIATSVYGANVSVACLTVLLNNVADEILMRFVAILNWIRTQNFCLPRPFVACEKALIYSRVSAIISTTSVMSRAISMLLSSLTLRNKR